MIDYPFNQEKERSPEVAPPDPTGQHVSVPNQGSTDDSKADTETSNLTDSSHHAPVLDPHIKEILERMDGRIGEMVSAGKPQVSQTELQAQVLRSESLAANNTKLQESNNALQTQVQELIESHATDKEGFLVEKTRLELQWQSAKDETTKLAQTLEEVRSALEGQVAELNDDKQRLKNQVIGLEKDLQAAMEKLHATQGLLQAVKNENATEKDSLAARYERLEGVNANLIQRLDDSKESRMELERQVDSLQRAVDDAQAKLATANSELEQAHAQILQQDKNVSQLQSEQQEMEAIVNELKQEIVELNRENEEERVNFQSLNEDSAKAFEKLNQSIADRDQKVGELFQQLGNVQLELKEERASTTEALAQIQASKDSLAAENAELSKALEEAMNNVDNLDKDRKYLQQKLSEATESLNEAKQSNEAVQAESKVTLEKQAQELEDVCQELEQSEKQRQALHEQLVATQASLQDASSAQADAVNKNAESLEALKNIQLSLSEERLRREEVERRVRDLGHDLQTVSHERDSARSNMLGFNDREAELYRKLVEGDRIRKEMHGKIMQLMGNIRVFVRVRPALPGEQQLAASNKTCAKDGKKRKRAESEVEEPFRFPGVYDRDDKRAHFASGVDDATKNIVEVLEPRKDRGGLKERRKKWRYGFDKVFSPQSGQEDVWDATEPLVQCAVDGFNVSIFAYGQTGSGKTHTMLGEPGNEGIVSRSIKKLFDAKAEVEALSRGESQVSLSVELLEIYNEKVRDLLAPKSGANGQEVNLKVTSQEVVGNTIVETSTEEEVKQILEMAQSRRCVKATASNSESSRSHMLFTVHFHVTTKDGVTQEGKLNVCDLAGSERLGKSGAHLVGGALLEETKHINKSLSVLSNVIERLQAGEANVPFRESKLTFLLKDSLSGNSKTLAIVCCNPLSAHVNESVSSLRFAAKVNRVDLKAVANVSC